MNERATASVNAIIKALPFDIPDDLLLLSIFGSQAKGTERPDSDLDVLVRGPDIEGITLHGRPRCHNQNPRRRHQDNHHPAHPGHRRLDGQRVWDRRVGRTPRAGRQNTLAGIADFDIKQHPDIDYDYSAGRWLDMARKDIFPRRTTPDHGPGRPAFGRIWRHATCCGLA